DDIDNLPYPGELPRKDFLAPNFNPQTYLSSLRNRHQTLEDLRTDLRQRSQALNQELLDLVNGNYDEFLSLGSDLKGGEEKIEGVRVGLLGFRREVEGIQRGVRERAGEMGELLREKKGLRKDVMLGRALLGVEEGLTELEGNLGMIADDAVMEEEEDSEDDDVDGIVSSGNAARKMQRHVEQYVLLTRQIERMGPNHPFLLAQQPRVDAVRKTMLLDLSATLRQAKASKTTDDILRLVRLYADLDAERESVRVLKG
ncbi:hypothetical protein BAUCODRAFT_58775, partial [Baudoinia panamericana UAMH 10762]